MSPSRRAALAASAACLFGGTLAHAGTESFNNENLEFVLVPHQYTFGPPYHLWTDENDLYLYHSPAENAAGLGAGPAMYQNGGRLVVSSSQPSFDFLRRTFGTIDTIELALSNEFELYNPSGINLATYQPLATFEPGDIINDFDFANDNGADATGPISGYCECSGNGLPVPTPFLGEEAIVGYRFEEPGGTRFGFIRLTWFENYPLERTCCPGSPLLVDLYLPTAWGYSDTLDEGVLVVIPALCPADLDGSGSLNLDDVDAFAAAFAAGDLAADLDGSGSLNIDDVDAFAAAFLAGC